MLPALTSAVSARLPTAPSLSPRCDSDDMSRQVLKLQVDAASTLCTTAFTPPSATATPPNSVRSASSASSRSNSRSNSFFTPTSDAVASCPVSPVVRPQRIATAADTGARTGAAVATTAAAAAAAAESSVSAGSRPPSPGSQLPATVSEEASSIVTTATAEGQATNDRTEATVTNATDVVSRSSSSSTNSSNSSGDTPVQRSVFLSTLKLHTNALQSQLTDAIEERQRAVDTAINHARRMEEENKQLKAQLAAFTSKTTADAATCTDESELAAAAESLFASRVAFYEHQLQLADENMMTMQRTWQDVSATMQMQLTAAETKCVRLSTALAEAREANEAAAVAHSLALARESEHAAKLEAMLSRYQNELAERQEFMQRLEAQMKTKATQINQLQEELAMHRHMQTAAQSPET